MSSAPSIREARAHDLTDIARLYEEDDLHAASSEPQDDTSQAYRSALDAIQRDPNNRVYVAELDGAVVGTFQLTFIQQLTYGGALVAQLESVVVSASARSRGVGTHMLRWTIEAAKQRGCLRIQLTSNVRRTRAHAFYERLGFVASHKGMKLLLR
jgi:GNAT superfamily N-acetyltransferase